MEKEDETMRRKKQESGIEYDEKLLQHIAPIGNMTLIIRIVEREQGMKHVFIFFITNDVR